MKVIQYKALGKTIVAVEKEDGTFENVEQDLFYDVEKPYSEQNEELAKKEAYQGEYTIEDDGHLEPEPQPTDAERIAELEEALALLLSGVTE